MLVELLSMMRIRTADNTIKDVTFHVCAGELIVIVGRSNSGKFRLSQILSEEVSPLSGSLAVLGGSVTASSGVLSENGIFVIRPQYLIENLSAMDQICAIGGGVRRLFFSTRRQLPSLLRLQDRFHVHFDLRTPIRLLNAFEKLMVAVFQCVRRGARLLVFSMSGAPSAYPMFEDVVAELRSMGISVLLLVNSADSIPGFSDRVYLLHNGRIAMTLDPRAQDTAEILNAVLTDGDEPVPFSNPPTVTRPLVHVSGLSSAALLRDCSLSLYSGECAGILDRSGAGRTLAHILGGDLPYTGEIHLDGAPVRLRSIADAQKKRIVMIDENVYDNGNIRNLDLEDNLTLFCYPAISRFSIINPRKRRYLANQGRDILQTCNVPYNAGMVGNTFSALMQSVARALLFHPRLLILVFPFQYLDSADRRKLQNMINRIKRGDMSLLVVSSDAEILKSIADRMFLSDGNTLKRA